MNPTLYYLNIRNRGGSVEHFYHFMFGYLLPLCTYLSESREERSLVLARSCGPLDTIVAELNVPGLILCERKSHRRMRRRASDAGLREVEILGLDFGAGRNQYEPEKLRYTMARGGLYILRRLRAKIDAHQRVLEGEWGSTPRFLVIEREAPDPYYLSAYAEIQGAGAARRDILNSAEMVFSLEKTFVPPRVVSLQGKSLAEQIALFRMADVVIAQHGAALSNVIWMRADAHVFEFVNEPEKQNHFSDLSKIFGIAHTQLIQDRAVGPVNVNQLLDAVTKKMTAPTECR